MHFGSTRTAVLIKGRLVVLPIDGRGCRAERHRCSPGRARGQAVDRRRFSCPAWADDLESTQYVLRRHRRRAVRSLSPTSKNGPLGICNHVARQPGLSVLARLSLDRIEVMSDNGSVLVSPKDKTAFIQAIRARKPSVVVEELPEIA